jgi:hypothetical protein
MNIRKLSSKNIYFIVVAAITAMCILGWRLTTDIYADDLFYMHRFTHAEILYDQGPLVKTFSDAIDAIVYHYNWCNCRLANMVCILSMLLPRVMVNVIDAIVGCIFFFMLFKSARINLKQVNMTTAIVGGLMFWLAFPWYNTMSSTAFYMNYAWSSAFSLAVIFFLRKSYKQSKLQLSAVTFLAVLAAWMHEAFGCALIAYTFFVWLLGAKVDKKSRLIIGLGLCVGLFVTVVGSTNSRIDSTLSDAPYVYLKYALTLYASQLWPAYVAIITTIMLRKKIGKQQFSAYRVETIASFSAIAVSCAIAMAVNGRDRVLWPAHLFSTIQTLRCVAALTYKERNYSKIAKFVFGCVVVLYALWGCDLIKWQSKFTSENNELIVSALKVDKPVVYYDLTSDSDVPFYLLGIVNRDWFNYHNFFLAIFTEHGYTMLILPTKYEGVPIDEIQDTGSHRVKGIYPVFYTVNDTTLDHFDAILGEPQSAVTPIDRSLMKFIEPEVRQQFEKSFLPAFYIDGKIIKYYTPIAVGRTVKHRKFVRIEE